MVHLFSKVASANGQDSVVSLLISRGANIEHADSSGWTALHQVLEIVPLLLMFYINMWAGKCLVFRVVSTDTPQQWCCFLLQEQAWSPRISRSSKISVIPSLLRLQMVNLVEMVILVKWSTWPNGQLGQMVNLVKWSIWSNGHVDVSLQIWSDAFAHGGGCRTSVHCESCLGSWRWWWLSISWSIDSWSHQYCILDTYILFMPCACKVLVTRIWLHDLTFHMRCLSNYSY